MRLGTLALLALAAAMAGCGGSGGDGAARAERDRVPRAGDDGVHVTVEEAAAADASTAVRVLGERGHRLDGTLASLAQVDRFIDRQSARPGVAAPGSLLGSERADTLAVLGAYVGEVVRRATGATWDGGAAPLEVAQPGALRTPDGKVVFPYRAVRDRFRHGAERSLVVYGGVVARDVARRLARLRRAIRSGGPRRITVGQADTVLREMLVAAGVDPERPPPRAAPLVWRVFKRFARIPADAPDTLLVQYGVYDFFNEGEAFELDFTRQFELPGRDAPLIQVSATMRFEPTADLAAIEPDERWSPARGPRSTFLRRAQSMPGFVAVGARRPMKVRIGFEEAE